MMPDLLSLTLTLLAVLASSQAPPCFITAHAARVVAPASRFTWQRRCASVRVSVSC